MHAALPQQMSASCQCGKVKFAVAGAPILTTACYCTSCREAGRRFEQRPETPAVREPDGSTDFILYRKDRVRCTAGEELLEEHRLTPESPSRRVVATCCGSAMFLEFAKGHWLSMYRRRFPEDAPKLEMRVMTRDRNPDCELPDDVPGYATHSIRFMWKLLSAWAAMGFRAPAIPYGKVAK